MDRIKKYINNKVTKFALMLIIISVIGGATVLYINHEKNEQIKMERLQAERQAASGLRPLCNIPHCCLP